jgi:hypothetical protein
LTVIRRLGNSEIQMLDRGSHPLAALADLGLGQSDDRERRQAIGEVDLDPHLGAFMPIRARPWTTARGIVRAWGSAQGRAITRSD